jgi:hypothetical protein
MHPFPRWLMIGCATLPLNARNRSKATEITEWRITSGWQVSCVPDLAEEEGTLRVHRINDGLPGLHLLLAPQSWHLRVRRCRLRHRAGLGDEKDARRRSLRVEQSVVGLCQVSIGPAARHRRKNDPAIAICTHKIKTSLITYAPAY